MPTPVPTPKKRGMIELNDEVMREAKKSLKEKGIKSEDVVGTPDYPSGIPDMHTIHDPMISVS
jgi:hypothetical protein